MEIVKRLRGAAAQGQDIYGIHCDVELEAADEIERLRALLSEAAPYVDRARISHLGTNAAITAHNKRCLDLLDRMRAVVIVEQKVDQG